MDFFRSFYKAEEEEAPETEREYIQRMIEQRKQDTIEENRVRRMAIIELKEMEANSRASWALHRVAHMHDRTPEFARRFPGDDPNFEGYWPRTYFPKTCGTIQHHLNYKINDTEFKRWRVLKEIVNPTPRPPKPYKPYVMPEEERQKAFPLMYREHPYNPNAPKVLIVDYPPEDDIDENPQTRESRLAVVQAIDERNAFLEQYPDDQYPLDIFESLEKKLAELIKTHKSIHTRNDAESSGEYHYDRHHGQGSYARAQADYYGKDEYDRMYGAGAHDQATSGPSGTNNDVSSDEASSDHEATPGPSGTTDYALSDQQAIDNARSSGDYQNMGDTQSSGNEQGRTSSDSTSEEQTTTDSKSSTQEESIQEEPEENDIDMPARVALPPSEPWTLPNFSPQTPHERKEHKEYQKKLKRGVTRKDAWLQRELKLMQNGRPGQRLFREEGPDEFTRQMSCGLCIFAWFFLVGIIVLSVYGIEHMPGDKYFSAITTSTSTSTISSRLTTASSVVATTTPPSSSSTSTPAVRYVATTFITVPTVTVYERGAATSSLV